MQRSLFARGHAVLLLVGLLGALASPGKGEAQARKGAANPAATPHERKDAHAVSRNKSILSRVKKGNVDLVFLGDSITEGLLNTSFWKKRYEPLNGANLGVGSDRTDHVLWRITKGGQLKGLKPKLVVLLIGTNNIGTHKIDQIAGGVSAIIQAIQSNDTSTKVLLMGVFPRKQKANHRDRKTIRDLNVMLAKLANGDRVQFLDIGAKFLDSKGDIPKALMPDFLHPSPSKGDGIWADAIQPTIDRVVGKPSKPAPPTPAPASTELGSLSEKYESSGRGPGTVSTGKGDVGGVSYGTYQLASKLGRADAFVRKYYPREFKGLKGGTPKFTAEWKKLAKEDPKKLHENEHQFIKETHFDVLVQHLSKSLKLQVGSHGKTFQDVIWSTAVQHGPGTNIVDIALKPLMSKSPSEEQMIRAIYAERGRKDAKGQLVHFKGNSASVQKGVAGRFRSELRDALAALKKEGK